ncbi:hypothetical protein A3C57_03105 [Candidatus Nomurabacteria bacterium RIFCSPHIGHO2_02_FULL_33_12]|uniref:TraC-like domain-containing protein n=1 Tax=Candidatus Nomurabacteria bacterium RIFCSPLOWO2_01_FULL_33_17 TaxID=1801764 RepID=A0A1F6WR03_9BACT|nr:MAG: hypothetical protein A3C57_03105 [Candidatus Nomurabacteria bacterium RIFCSPHIGHO2_02_FULL_33_12]OGI84311.1 MAG: hypothetical protein A2903_01920 [Candidatus Nomurabacteria bacterium RIFCSPLOWO2_01_FULL_33_17]
MLNNAPKSQNFVPIEKIRDGVVMLKDGSLRAILLCTAINFTLRSLDEQKAILSQFQSMLNSLDFSTQIIVESRKFDIRPYLITLEGRLDKIEEPLLKFQTKEYIEFIRELTGVVNIMSKHFYVVVPYDEAILETGGFFQNLFGGVGGLKKKESKEESSWNEKRNQLEQRLGIVIQGLGRCGVRSEPLETQALVEMYYKTFNPGDSAQYVPKQEEK